MKKLLLALLISLMLWFSVTANTRTSVSAISPQVVRLTSIETGSRCTGFIIDESTLITAAHCVASLADRLEAEFHHGRDKSVFTPVFIGVPEGADDFAVLLGDTQGIEPVATEPLVLTGPQAVYSISARNDFRLIPGYLIALEPEQNYVFMAPVLPGDSGGPLFGNSERVVGVVWGMGFTADGRHHLGFAVPITRVLKKMQEL